MVKALPLPPRVKRSADEAGLDGIDESENEDEVTAEE